MLSPSASSSAVVIPTPGKSILKRPPPPQQSFFSRLSKLLPTQAPQPNPPDDASTLKRAHFILPEMTMVYPISALNPPSTPSLREEKRSIEEREAERRRRVVRGSSSSDNTGSDEWWSLDRVDAFYRECCTGREEVPEPSISAAFKVRFFSCCGDRYRTNALEMLAGGPYHISPYAPVQRCCQVRGPT